MRGFGSYFHSMKLPEVTYPLSIDTIGKTLATGHELSVHCNTQGCHHRGRVNLVALARRLGIDHSSMAVDLKPHFYCPKCREAGRRDDDFNFILHAPTYPKSAWPREERRPGWGRV